MRRALLLAVPVVAGALLVHAPRARAQVLAEPVLHGKVFVGDSVLDRGRVVLHHVSMQAQGEVDSTGVAPDGTFTFHLPSVPDSVHSEIYFASVRHAGILYFGPALVKAIQLDSLYVIHTWDTTMVATEGVPLPVQTRNIFLEQDSGHWVATDLFQVRNESNRTLVASPGGLVWRYPLAAGATHAVVIQSDVGSDAEGFEDGDLVIRAPLSPGDQLFVARYRVPDPYLTLRLPGITEQLNILVREPAPPIDAPGFTVMQPVQMDPGATFRRYGAMQLHDGVARLSRGTAPRSPPVRWFSVVLAVILAGVGLWAFGKGNAGAVSQPSRAADTRRALLVEVAALDDAFEARVSPSPEERKGYEVRRRDLLRRLRALG